MRVTQLTWTTAFAAGVALVAWEIAATRRDRPGAEIGQHRRS